MSCRHGYYEGEEIIDERVKCLVHKRPPRQVGHTLQLVIDKELGQHEEEAEGIDPVGHRLQDPATPGLVWHVEQTRRGPLEKESGGRIPVDSSPEAERNQQPGQIPHGL